MGCAWSPVSPFTCCLTLVTLKWLPYFSCKALYINCKEPKYFADNKLFKSCFLSPHFTIDFSLPFFQYSDNFLDHTGSKLMHSIKLNEVFCTGLYPPGSFNIFVTIPLAYFSSFFPMSGLFFLHFLSLRGCLAGKKSYFVKTLNYCCIYVFLAVLLWFE